MKLNMHIILEDLQDLRPKYHITEDRLVRRFNFHSPMVDCKTPFEDQVYIVDTSQLEELLTRGLKTKASFVCAGIPPLTIRETCDVIWVEGDIRVDQLVMRLTEIFNTYMQWEFSVREAISTDQPLRKIAELSLPVIRHPLWMWDAHFQTVFNVYDQRYGTLPDDYLYLPEGQPWEAWMINMWDKQTSKEANRKLLQLETPYFMPTPPEGFVGYECLCQNIFYEGMRIATLCVDEIGGRFTDRDYALISAMAEFCFDGLRYSAKTNISTIQPISEMLLALIQEKHIERVQLEKSLRFRDWQADDTYFAIVVKPNNTLYNERLLSHIGNEVYVDLIRQVYIVNEGMILFVSNNTRSPYERHELARRILQVLKKSDFDMLMGVSEKWSGIKRITHAYQQAMMAVEWQEEHPAHAPLPSESEAAQQLRSSLEGELNKDEYSNCVFFDDIAFDTFMSKISAQQEIKCFVPYNLHLLDQYDKAHHDNQCEILRVYLDCNCSSTEAAKRLYIHRNTLNYKIEHIKEVLRNDLSDPDFRLELSLALRLKDHI